MYELGYRIFIMESLKMGYVCSKSDWKK